ncbi:hypothetical protein [Calothrix sp. CCY 0018]|uniref:hypothetical protein n=1 Tax=Calothrix sp. CCY 0018 TaxID=3103864 RepID=UPI0039C6665D
MNIIKNLKVLVILSCLYSTAFLAILSGYPAKVSLEVKAFSVKVIVERYLLTDKSPSSQCIIDLNLPSGEIYASRQDI